MKRYRKRTITLLLTCLFLLTALPPIPAAAANPAREDLRAVWVASVYNLDYPAKATVSPEQLKKEADAILQSSANMGMNAVVLQVRPSCDALYPSALFPWSSYLTGTQGTAPTGGFDPLAYWVTRAHALGLELHAWVNPYRVTKKGAAELAALSPNNPAKLHPEWVVEFEKNYYLNPGIPEVRELVLQGAEELVRNYDLDGIHMDDYFYPGKAFNDGAAFAQYGGGFASLDDWRRDNVNTLVREMGTRVHAIKPQVSYGVSPAGVWADSDYLAAGSNTRGNHQTYFDAFADSRKWVKEGWVDYICPQIYWPIGHARADYKTLANWWADTVRGTGVKLYIGMADYQAGNAKTDSPWYGITAIQNQLALNQTIPEVAGEMHFRYALLNANAALVKLYTTQYTKDSTTPIIPPASAVPSPSPAASPMPTPVPTPSATPIPTPPTTGGGEKPELDMVGHSAYLQGSEGHFRPDATLTRAEAVAILARLSVDGEGDALYTATPYTGGFTDVDADMWYAPFVAFARQYGIVNGYLDGTFRPNDPVSRAELVKLVGGYFEISGGKIGSFQDIPADHWAQSYLSYASLHGWLPALWNNGAVGSLFQPQTPATRAQAAALLNRAMERRPDQAYLTQNAALNPFQDVTTSHWAYYDILEASLTHGYDNEDSGEVWTEISTSKLS